MERLSSPLRQSSTMAQSSGPSHTRSPSFFSFRKNQSHSNSDSHLYPSPSMSLTTNGNDINSSYDQPLPSLQPIQPSQDASSHPPSRQPSTNASQLHPEIRSLIQLNTAHAYKIYYSGPLVRRVDRLPDGQKATKDEGWTDVWAQLGGTTLSIWDMKQVQEASKQGREVPPTYINMTDAFIKVLGAVTEPQTPTTPAKRYTDILAVNTAGSNLIFFSCPSREALIAWIAALRLSSWEKSRLEEIYTAHLLRITQQARDVPSTLMRGKMEGWVRIRIAGQTDWKRLWMVVQAGTDGERPTSPGFDSSSGVLRKRRVSNLFSKDHGPVPARPVVVFYLSQKPKDKKRPLLTLQCVTQTFAVYPERPELINRSTLIKVEGQFANEELAKDMGNREGWILIMPDLEGGNNQVGEMLKWIIALHDAFGLYGRPHGWTWDPRERASLMFGYPVGPQKESLFLDREAAETLDPRDDRTSAIRSNLQKLLFNKMQNAGIRAVSPEHASPQALSSMQQQLPPQQPPPLLQQQPMQQQPVPGQSNANAAFGPQLPPLNFGDLGLQQRTPLPPVAEVSGATTPEMRTKSIDVPPTTAVHPSTSTQSFTTNQVHRRQPSANSLAPSSDAVSSPQLQPSSLPASLKGKAREGSVTRGSLPSPRQRGQPIAVSASQSTSDDRPPSRTSILTSPHSIVEKVSPSESVFNSKSRAADNMSILSSPYSLGSIRRELPPLGPPPDMSLPSEPSNDVQALINEAGALYYVNNVEGDLSKQQPANRIPTTISEKDDTSSSESDQQPTGASLSSPATSPPPTSVSPSSPKMPEISKPVPIRQNVPTPFAPTQVNRQSPIARSGLGRKPSGARELGTSRPYNNGSVSSSPRPLAEEDSDSDNSMVASQLPPPAKNASQLPPDDSNLDVLAALSYLDVNGEQLPSQPASKPVEPLRIRSPEPSLPSSPPEPSMTLTPASNDPMQATQYRSSFAPSKQAVERKAKVQAQQMAHHAAVHKPGRANGKGKSKMGGAWGESSEEEEEDEEDEEDEADSDDDRPVPNKPYRPPSGNTSSNPSIKPPHSQNPSLHHGDAIPESSHPGLRGPRTLPQLPSGPPHGDEHPPQPRRMVSDQFLEANRRPLHDDIPHIRSQTEFPHPGPAQKTLWSQVLEPGRTTGHFPENHHARDTFIQLEHPSETMTKAFTPQGLLSAGLQDKQDRSAKRQEELAREMGASLINVPNKPPPPQTGLLGAITAHERERKREGGMGAALTEREREKRLAEERQRRFDEQQRQQLEQIQQGGSMYNQYPGFNPMMNPMMMGMVPMNPMMTGMAPMMTGGAPMMTTGGAPMMTAGGAPMMTGGMAPMMTGYQGMMPGLNHQQMFAAQQAAAQAYQQAMMSFSTAGSHVGGGENGGGAQPMVPNMTGSMGFMGGYDPRLSMMGMGMMGPQMGVPLGMQMTGMSAFDPRFPMNGGNVGPMNDMGLQPPNVLGGQRPASRSNSPARRDSPATRPHELLGEAQKNSRPASPKP